MSKRSTHPRKAAKLKVKNLSRKWKKRAKVSRGSIVWRLLRGIIFIFCLTLFFYQSAKFLLVYYKYPTTTKIEFTHPYKFEFPAVTFCNRNPVKRSKFCAEYPDLCESPVNITELCEVNPYICKDSPSNLLIPKLGFFANNSREEITQTIYDIYFKGNLTKEFWEEWAWGIDTNSIQSKIKPVFVTSPGRYFPCYAENLLLNSTDEPQKIDLGPRYGQRMIRRYDLNIQRSDEMLIAFEPYVVLSIHSPFVPVNPFGQGRSLKLGYKYNIYIRLKEEKLLPFPYETNCTNYEDLWSKSSRHTPRSQEMCKELCLHDLFELNKNMTPEFEMLEYPLKLCLARECRTSFEDRKVLERCRKDCKKSCRNLKYTSTIIETVLDNKKEFRDFEDKIQVEIFLGDRQIVVERHAALYDTGHLFSYIGGLMGCWLGVSIWAFAGIAENVFRRAIMWMEHIKRYFKETSQAPHVVFSTHRNNVHNMKIL